MNENRRSAEIESPVWRAISEYRLLSQSISQGLKKLVAQAANHCGCSSGVFVLLREPLPQMREVSGYALRELSPDSIFLQAANSDAVLIADDASQDPQLKTTAESKLGEKIGLFASIAVRAPNGVVIGALSVFDQKTRADLPKANPALLGSFGQVFDQFLLRRSAEELEPSTGLLGRTVFESNFIDEWQHARAEDNAVACLILSLPTLGRITQKFGVAKADQMVALLAQLLRQKLMINRQIFGRLSGSSVGIYLPEALSTGFLNASVGAVREELIEKSGVMLESAASVFHLRPAAHPEAEPATILRVMERITARRNKCRLEQLAVFSANDIRELANAPQENDPSGND